MKDLKYPDDGNEDKTGEFGENEDGKRGQIHIPKKPKQGKKPGECYELRFQVNLIMTPSSEFSYKQNLKLLGGVTPYV